MSLPCCPKPCSSGTTVQDCQSQFPRAASTRPTLTSSDGEPGSSILSRGTADQKDLCCPVDHGWKTEHGGPKTPHETWSLNRKGLRVSCAHLHMNLVLRNTTHFGVGCGCLYHKVSTELMTATASAVFKVHFHLPFHLFLGHPGRLVLLRPFCRCGN